MSASMHVFLTESMQILAVSAARGQDVPPPTNAIMVIRMAAERLQGVAYKEALFEIYDLFAVTASSYATQFNRQAPKVDLLRQIHRAVGDALQVPSSASGGALCRPTATS